MSEITQEQGELQTESLYESSAPSGTDDDKDKKEMSK